jgi:hypothetical protein
MIRCVVASAVMAVAIGAAHAHTRVAADLDVGRYLVDPSRGQARARWPAVRPGTPKPAHATIPLNRPRARAAQPVRSHTARTGQERAASEPSGATLPEFACAAVGTALALVALLSTTVAFYIDV